MPATVTAFALNLALVWGALRWASIIHHVFGTAGSQAVAKVSSLLLGRWRER